MSSKRKIEILSVGYPVCEAASALVTEFSVPTVVIDGKPC